MSSTTLGSDVATNELEFRCVISRGCVVGIVRREESGSERGI